MNYRAYQPVTPGNNKFLKKRWDQNRYSLHRKKVDFAIPLINNTPPETFMHLHIKLKKLQMEEERLANVERDNRILMEKMSYVMRTKGRIDNWNTYEQKSLNKSKRQRDLLRVTHENQAILKRISTKEPYYNHFLWEDDWRIMQGYMANISKYPQDWGYTQNSLAYSSQPKSYYTSRKTFKRVTPILEKGKQKRNNTA